MYSLKTVKSIQMVEAGIKYSGSSERVTSKNCVMYGNNIGASLNGLGVMQDCIISNNTIGVQSIAGSVLTYCDVWNKYHKL